VTIRLPGAGCNDCQAVAYKSSRSPRLLCVDTGTVDPWAPDRSAHAMSISARFVRRDMERFERGSNPGRRAHAAAIVHTNHQGDSMRTDIYVNYNGTCEEAFRFYEKHLGGKVTLLTTHGAGPESARFSDEWKGKVLHARLELNNAMLMGADIPSAEPMRSAYVTLTLDTAAEAERVYALLTDGGQIFMKMEETFFASRFAMLRDRFGTSWMLLHEHPVR